MAWSEDAGRERTKAWMQASDKATVLDCMRAMAKATAHRCKRVFQLFIAEEFSRNLVIAAAILVAMGVHWLWTDDIPGP